MDRVIGVTDAKRDFNRIASEVAESGESVLVMRRNRPLVAITPPERGFLEKPRGERGREGGLPIK